MLSNDCTFSFAGRGYQIVRQHVKAGRGKSLRIELHLSGTIRAPFEGQYVDVSESGVKAPAASKVAGNECRKHHNSGGKIDWVEVRHRDLRQTLVSPVVEVVGSPLEQLLRCRPAQGLAGCIYPCQQGDVLPSVKLRETPPPKACGFTSSPREYTMVPSSALMVNLQLAGSVLQAHLD
ncbi:MAG: hypothetical protein ACHRHE_24490, partial [Tepidisphaerales bacterium]